MAMSNLSNGEVPVVSGQVLPCIDDLLSGGSFFSNDFVNGGAGGGVQPHQVRGALRDDICCRQNLYETNFFLSLFLTSRATVVSPTARTCSSGPM